MYFFGPWESHLQSAVLDWHSIFMSHCDSRQVGLVHVGLMLSHQARHFNIPDWPLEVEIVNPLIIVLVCALALIFALALSLLWVWQWKCS